MTSRLQLKMADKDPKDEITPVGPGADEDDQPAAPATSRAGDDYQYPADEEDEARVATGGDERAGHAEDDGEDDPAEAGLSREQKRRRRKRERYDRLEREANFLRIRNEQLEREQSKRLAAMENRQTQSDVMAIDSRISQAESDVREAETLLQQAMDAKDSASAVEALRVRDQLRDGLNQLKGAKQQTVRQAQARQHEADNPKQNVPPPEVISRAEDWKREHNWFDPNGRDEDSAIALTVERRLFAEGRLNPASDDYWEEVDRRLAKRLPDRYRNGSPESDDEDDDRDTRPARRVNSAANGNGARKASGPTFKVGGRERPLRKGEVYIDEDRKAAMVEAGVWDDPKERERFMRSYQKYDRDAGRRPR